MDKISEYADSISIGTWVVGAILCGWLITLIPARLRLPIAIALMCVVLCVGKLKDLGTAATVCKVLSGVTFIAVGAAALMHPGPRIFVPPTAWSFAVVAGVSTVFVWNAIDGDVAVLIHANWVLLCIAGILTARTIASRESLMTVVYGVFAGVAISSLVTFSQLALDPMKAISAGFSRFTPYGCNPNQIALTYAVTAGIGLCLSLLTNNVRIRCLVLGLTALAVGQAVLSVSRTAVLFLAILCLPTFFRLVRRPVYAVLSSVVLLTGVTMLLNSADEASFERIDRGLDRSEHWNIVLEDIAERPMTGLLGIDYLYAIELEHNPHNAYVQFLYLGGLTLAGPLFAAQLWGHYCAFRVWRDRHRLPMPPEVITLLTALSACQFASGMINSIIYYPTYAWAFLTVLLNAMFIGLHASLNEIRRRESLPYMYLSEHPLRRRAA